MSIVDERLAALKARIELLDHIDGDGEDAQHRADGDDTVFVAEVKAILSQRELSLDEVADMRKPFKDREKVALAARISRLMQQHGAGAHNKLFSVANKSQMRIDVIAMDVETATQFAVRAGRVRSADNATVFRYNEAHIEKITKDGSALGRAVKEGVPGVVEKRGKNVIVGDRVFTPMTIV